MLKGMLSLILPAYNEEDNIKGVLERCYAVLAEVADSFEVIVVDDGSSDTTAQIVQELVKERPALRLIQHPTNYGYGQAVISGIQASCGDYLFLMDADGQFDFQEIKKLIPHIRNYDMVIGYRLRRRDKKIRLVAARLFNLAMRVLFGIKKIRDINCAFKLFCAESIKGLDLKSKGALINTEIMFKAMRNKNNVYQVCVTHYPRLFGKQTGLKPRVVLRAVYETLKLLIKLRVKKKEHLLSFVSIISLALICYALALPGDFVYDDFHFIVNNHFIKNFFGNFLNFFINRESVSYLGRHMVYRPLRTISFSLDYFLFGLKSSGYHFVNLILHSLNGLLVFKFLLFFLKDWRVCLFSSLIFISHPLQVESVAWISSRGDLLFSFFFLLAFLTYLKGKHLFLTTLLYMSSLLSKESAAVFPLLIILYDVIFQNKKMRTRLKFYSLIFFISIIFIFIRFSVLGSFAQKGWWGGSPYYNFLTVIKVGGSFLRLLIFPFNLRLIYDVAISKSILEPEVLFSLGLLITSFIFFISSLKSNILVCFSIAWFFIHLLPYAQLFPISGGFLCEHYLYLALVGFCLLIGLVAKKALDRFRRFAFWLGFFLIVVFSLLTIRQSLIWQNHLSLWLHQLRYTPHNAKSHAGLGQAYLELNRFKEAEEELKTALAVDPYNLEANYNLGLLYGYQSRFRDSIEYFKRTLIIEPRYAPAHNNLAVSYIGLWPPQAEFAQWHLDKAKMLGYPVKDGLQECIRLYLKDHVK